MLYKGNCFRNKHDDFILVNTKLLLNNAIWLLKMIISCLVCM